MAVGIKGRFRRQQNTMAPRRPRVQKAASSQSSDPRITSLAATKVGLVVGLVPIIYCWSFSALRIAPAYGLGVVVLTSLALILMDKRFRSFAAFPLLAVSIIYLPLSFANALPAAWTQYWLPEFILRQWMWAPLLFILSNSLCILFTYHSHFIVQNSLNLTIIGFIIGRVSLFLSPLGFDIDKILTVYTLIPENASFLFTLSIFVFLKMKKNVLNFLLLLLLIPIFSSAQSLILFISIIFISFFGFGKLLVTFFVISAAIAMIVAPNYASELYNIDSNTGFRAIIWRDAIEAFIGSDFIGVGFGTEYIKNHFDPFGAKKAFSVAIERTEDRMLIGSHNTAFDVALRMGVPGLVALGAWLFVILRRARLWSGEAAKLSSFMLLFLLFNNAVNMGFTTINFLMCTVLCSGWLVAVDHRAKSTPVSADRPRS